MKNVKSSTGKSVYEIVTERIVGMLQQEILPWVKPWDACRAVNYVTQRPYTGINILLLDRAGEYLTYKQLKDAGGTLKPGAETYIAAQYVVKPAKDEEEEEATESDKKSKGYAYMRYFRLYHITDCVGIESKQKKIFRPHQPLQQAEQLVANYPDKPPIKVGYNQAAYYPVQDIIKMPVINHFDTAEAYYSVLYHELVHSTGHQKRLKRPGVVASRTLERYSKEELIAEIGAAMLCTMTGIEHKTIMNSVAYIQAWASRLEDDPKLIVEAAAKAQAAVNYMTAALEKEEVA